MNRKLKTLVVFGTRPEAIKMAPVVKTLIKANEITCKVCVTGQHREMLDQVLDVFNIVPDYDLNLMKKNQSLNELTSSILNQMPSILDHFEPNLMLVHGDTATTFAASLSAYYHQIDVAHVEAGLRTDSIYSPWPEEINRRLTSRIAKIHFAPTQQAKQNLILENIPKENVFITGNSVIDAILDTKAKIESNDSILQNLRNDFGFLQNNKFILVTTHRRENFGLGISSICHALIDIAKKYPDLQIVFPVHLNPNVEKPVKKLLSREKNITLLPPLDYIPFVYMMMKSYMILTDSGGLQEEAPALGKPVLVMRENTERPEAVDAGTAKLVGTNRAHIVECVTNLLDDQALYSKMSEAKNPFGDGTAAVKIKNIILSEYNQL